MGHPTEIFLSSPPDSSTCAICHDVLQDAVSMKECGHTFCDGCAKTCLQTTKSCPNCRVEVTGCNPNFFARESIGAMQVKCPHGKHDDDEEGSKRRRGNDGDALPSEGCTWTGSCDDFENHDNACEFKIVTCELDGCDHKCRRRDMDSHLSGGGFLRHMNLMKHSNDRKMEAITARYDNKIQELKTESNRKIKLLQDQVRSLQESKAREEEKQTAFQIEVTGCGIKGINGTYKQRGDFLGAPKYCKRGYWEDLFALDGLPENDFYLCFANSLANVPPVHNWHVVSDDKDGKGEEPAPFMVQALIKNDSS
eukprot:scaffold73555_cov37-Cyclotella_meneghiniana.AAC.4